MDQGRLFSISGYLFALQIEDWIVDTQVAIDLAGHSASDSLYNKDRVEGKLKRGREKELRRKAEGGGNVENLEGFNNYR